MLLLEDVERVVDGDDAEHMAVVGNDRHGKEVVLGDLLGNVLLVILRARDDDLLGTDTGELCVGGRDDDLVQGDDA